MTCMGLCSCPHGTSPARRQIGTPLKHHLGGTALLQQRTVVWKAHESTTARCALACAIHVQGHKGRIPQAVERILREVPGVDRPVRPSQMRTPNEKTSTFSVTGPPSNISGAM